MEQEMKNHLQFMYGEYMQLREQTLDWLAKRKYAEKMKAIETLLEPMPYSLPNPITEATTVPSTKRPANLPEKCPECAGWYRGFYHLGHVAKICECKKEQQAKDPDWESLRGKGLDNKLKKW